MKNMSKTHRPPSVIKENSENYKNILKVVGNYPSPFPNLSMLISLTTFAFRFEDKDFIKNEGIPMKGLFTIRRKPETP